MDLTERMEVFHVILEMVELLEGLGASLNLALVDSVFELDK